MEGLFFYFFGTLAVLAALLTVTRKDPVTSAFWLIFCFLNVAALFATLSAHLMAVLQVLIYAGAIMVFFLFVTMFLGQTKRRAAGPGRFTFLVGLLTVAAVGFSMVRLLGGQSAEFPEVGDAHGTIEAVSELLLGNYLFAFELAGLLLTVAVIGAVLLARREAPGSRGTRTVGAKPVAGHAEQGAAAGGAGDA